MNKTKKHSAFLGRSTIERGEETTKVFMQVCLHQLKTTPFFRAVNLRKRETVEEPSYRRKL